MRDVYRINDTGPKTRVVSHTTFSTDTGYFRKTVAISQTRGRFEYECVSSPRKKKGRLLFAYKNRFYSVFIARKRVRACIRDLRDGNRCSVPGGGGGEEAERTCPGRQLFVRPSVPPTGFSFRPLVLDPSYYHYYYYYYYYSILYMYMTLLRFRRLCDRFYTGGSERWRI